MSFLDNLEDNLKALERQEEKDPKERVRREKEQAQTLAASPWAHKLKASPYTQELLNHASRAGQQMRAKLYIAWMDTVLRLELRTKRLELRPTPEGILAVFFEDNAEIRSEFIDLDGNPEELVSRWLAGFNLPGGQTTPAQ
ncbi:MAG TPA: hypothetical protein VMZ52_19140 [Bryobacteraceae bacterium]|nr:hypothetical protein [Bryobacteraceae bacterium]